MFLALLLLRSIFCVLEPILNSNILSLIWANESTKALNASKLINYLERVSQTNAIIMSGV